MLQNSPLTSTCVDTRTHTQTHLCHGRSVEVSGQFSESILSFTKQLGAKNLYPLIRLTDLSLLTKNRLVYIKMNIFSFLMSISS